MMILVGGILAVIVGVVLLLFFFCEILAVLAGIIPSVMIVGGLLAIYFGIDEIRHPVSDVDTYSPPGPKPQDVPAEEAPVATPSEEEPEEEPKTGFEASSQPEPETAQEDIPPEKKDETV